MKALAKEVLRNIGFLLIVALTAVILYSFLHRDMLAAERRAESSRLETAERTASEYRELQAMLDTLNQNVLALTNAMQTGISASEHTVQKRLGDIQSAIAGIKRAEQSIQSAAPLLPVYKNDQAAQPSTAQNTVVYPVTKDATLEQITAGIRAFENGDYVGAQQQFSNALLGDLANEKLALYLAASRYMAGNKMDTSSTKQQATFSDAVKKYGNDPVFLRCLITIAIQTGNWKEAALQYRIMLSVRNLPEAECKDAAEIALLAEEYRIAGEIYDVLSKLSQDKIQYLYASAAAYFKAGDRSTAKLRLQECLALDANNKSAKELLEQIGGN